MRDTVVKSTHAYMYIYVEKGAIRKIHSFKSFAFIHEAHRTVERQSMGYYFELFLFSEKIPSHNICHNTVYHDVK